MYGISFVDAANADVGQPIKIFKNSHIALHIVLCKIIVNLLPCLIFIVVGSNRQEIINLLPCLIFTAISRNGHGSYFYQQH